MNNLKYISTAGPIIGPPGWNNPPVDGGASKLLKYSKCNYNINPDKVLTIADKYSNYNLSLLSNENLAIIECAKIAHDSIETACWNLNIFYDIINYGSFSSKDNLKEKRIPIRMECQLYNKLHNNYANSTSHSGYKIKEVPEVFCNARMLAGDSGCLDSLSGWYGCTDLVDSTYYGFLSDPEKCLILVPKSKKIPGPKTNYEKNILKENEWQQNYPGYWEAFDLATGNNWGRGKNLMFFNTIQNKNNFKTNNKLNNKWIVYCHGGSFYGYSPFNGGYDNLAGMVHNLSEYSLISPDVRFTAGNTNLEKSYNDLEEYGFPKGLDKNWIEQINNYDYLGFGYPYPIIDYIRCLQFLIEHGVNEIILFGDSSGTSIVLMAMKEIIENSSLRENFKVNSKHNLSKINTILLKKASKFSKNKTLNKSSTKSCNKKLYDTKPINLCEHDLCSLNMKNYIEPQFNCKNDKLFCMEEPCVKFGIEEFKYNSFSKEINYKKIKKSIKGILLFSPWLDFESNSPSYDTQSYNKSTTMGDPFYPGVPGYEKWYAMYDAGAFLQQNYLNIDNTNLSDASPLHFDDSILIQFPPVYAMCGGAEVLKDENIQMQQKCKKLNVNWNLSVYDQMWHDFFEYVTGCNSGKILPQAKIAIQNGANFIKQIFENNYKTKKADLNFEYKNNRIPKNYYEYAAIPGQNNVKSNYNKVYTCPDSYGCWNSWNDKPSYGTPVEIPFFNNFNKDNYCSTIYSDISNKKLAKEGAEWGSYPYECESNQSCDKCNACIPDNLRTKWSFDGIQSGTAAFAYDVEDEYSFINFNENTGKICDNNDFSTNCYHWNKL